MKDKLAIGGIVIGFVLLLVVMNISISMLLNDNNDKPIQTVQSPTPTVTITKTVKVPGPKRTITRKVEVNRYPMCPDGMLSGDITPEQSKQLEEAGGCVFHP